MDDWRYAESVQRAQPRPSRFSYFLASLLGALVGALVTFWVLTGMGGRAPSPQPTAPPALPGVAARVEYGSVITEVANQVGAAVVGISNFVETGRGWEIQGTGSGVIIRDDGIIVTNYHVIEQAGGLSVSLSDGRKVRAEVVGFDRPSDLAVLQLEEAGPYPFALFGDSDAVRVGDLAIAIGNPLGEEFERTVTAGIISGLNRLVRVDPEVTIAALQTDAAINPGNSGGALLNAAGQVIGINSAKVRQEGVEGLGFAIPSNQVRPLVEQLLSTGRVVRPMLGIQYASPEVAAWYYGVQEGLWVYDTVAGGPARAAGIRPNDILIGLGDRSISSVGDLQLALRDHQPGDTVEVRVERNGRELTFSVVLAPGR